ncbi:MAG: DUF6512 family protein [Clostridiales bacterium]|nr:DUF6512 family protein [Clostridiales bacterium]
MNKTKYKYCELLGTAFTLLIGVILQNLYTLAADEPLSLIIASVNGSVWEKSKVFALPYAVWAIITYAVSKPRFKAFFVAKTVGAYSMIASCIALNCLAIGIKGTNYGFVEVIINLASVATGYIVSYKAYSFNKDVSNIFIPAVFGVALFVAAYFCFTFYPSHIEIFYDDRLNVYGIPRTTYYGDLYLDVMYG